MLSFLIPIHSYADYGVNIPPESFIGSSKHLHEIYDVPAIKNLIATKFGANSVLLSIAFCESTYTQYDENDNILRGKVNSDDVGVFQVNEYYHLDTSKKMGYDIYTVEGNLNYAGYLYKKYGLQPWSASYPCLKKLGVI